MFNFIVSGDSEAWESNTFSLDCSRCIKTNEYTDKQLAEKYGHFNEDSIKKLIEFPCIFAYEDGCLKDPKFGWITSIEKRREEIKVEYQIVELTPWLVSEDLSRLKHSFDIGGWELSRTHWALKNVDLVKELTKQGISIPIINKKSPNSINIDSINFQVAFSFPGENRAFVKQVADELKKIMPINSIFYDDDYTAFLARPSLDLLLQDIYGKRTDLLVVFLSEHYDKKDWCGIEFRAIREIIKRKEHNRIMYIRMDDKPVDGVLSIDGYIDSSSYDPKTIAEFIKARV